MTKYSLWRSPLLLCAGLLFCCAGAVVVAVAAELEESDEMSEASPLFSPSDLPLQYPPFDRVSNDDYLPAFEQGMEEQLAEIAAITEQSAEPTFDNTLVPLELSGQTLVRVNNMFFALSAADTNPDLDAIEVEVSPKIAVHTDQILLNAELFARIQSLYRRRTTLDLDPESLYLLEEIRRQFVRAGALLPEEEKEELRAINSELAELATAFSQNVLSEVNALAVVVEDKEKLAGLSEARIQAAADEAESRGLAGQYVLPLLNTSQQPVMAVLEDRMLRARILNTSLSRGSQGGEYDNREILSRTAYLRARKAQLLGYDNWAAYTLDNQTAKTVEAVNERLAQLTPPAVANAQNEAEDLQAMTDGDGAELTLAAWDWDYYADKLKAQRYAFDEDQLKPYLELDNVLQEGVFFAASQLYGLKFEERFDLPVYQEDVRVFDVFEENGNQLGIFIFDAYARPSKRGGAWMNAYVGQSHLLGTSPVVANHLNITKPPEGEPTLLTWDEVTTTFHEFGHALHGLFSDVLYPSFSGTNVPRDFVEYPSQVNEMWATWPEVLANYARHYETGEAMPQELLDNVLAADKFNQGYATTEYLAASIIDQALHQLTPEQVPTAEEMMVFEAQALSDAGIALDTVPPRYRLPYFSHIMGGYSAGYYSYIWSEVLDADTVEWFKENGGLTRENGDYFRDSLLSRGGTRDAMELFRDFRGRDAEIEPLLERRGLN